MTTTYKKILVPLDGSELAAQALPQAEEIAQESGAQLVLFRVLETTPTFVAAVPAAGGPGMVGGVGLGAMGIAAVDRDDEAHRRTVDEIEQSLETLAESLKHRKVEAEAVIELGDPATRIIDYAAKHGVDLIVMSTHGRTGLAHLAYGSVADKVRLGASCEVRVVRPSFK
ncbi:MAG TPA: universal stress protein [Caldilineaceae bacterium]|nr:universal stress protein [Caldilineaceae bacterium]